MSPNKDIVAAETQSLRGQSGRRESRRFRRFAVGVVTYDRPDDVERLIQRLLEQTVTLDELFIVDDSDNEMTKERVKANQQAITTAGIDLHYRHRIESSSMPGARNEIIYGTDCDIVCFLDDDTVPCRTWLEALIETYDSHPEAAGVGGPAIKTTSDLTPVAECITSINEPNKINEYGEVVDRSDRWIPDQTTAVDVFRGANMSFKVSALRSIGGFDTRYRGPAIFEEWDVMARLRNRQHELLYQPDARVSHVERDRGGTRADCSGPPPSYWYAKNSILFRKWNFPETFFWSLLRLFTIGTAQLPSVSRRFLGLFMLQTANLYWLLGYLDGILALLFKTSNGEKKSDNQNTENSSVNVT